MPIAARHDLRANGCAVSSSSKPRPVRQPFAPLPSPLPCAASVPRPCAFPSATVRRVPVPSSLVLCAVSVVRSDCRAAGHDLARPPRRSPQPFTRNEQQGQAAPVVGCLSRLPRTCAASDSRNPSATGRRSLARPDCRAVLIEQPAPGCPFRVPRLPSRSHGERLRRVLIEQAAPGCPRPGRCASLPVFGVNANEYKFTRLQVQKTVYLLFGKVHIQRLARFDNV